MADYKGKFFKEQRYIERNGFVEKNIYKSSSDVTVYTLCTKIDGCAEWMIRLLGNEKAESEDCLKTAVERVDSKMNQAGLYSKSEAKKYFEKYLRQEIAAKLDYPSCGGTFFLYSKGNEGEKFYVVVVADVANREMSVASVVLNINGTTDVRLYLEKEKDEYQVENKRLYGDGSCDTVCETFRSHYFPLSKDEFILCCEANSLTLRKYGPGDGVLLEERSLDSVIPVCRQMWDECYDDGKYVGAMNEVMSNYYGTVALEEQKTERGLSLLREYMPDTDDYVDAVEKEYKYEKNRLVRIGIVVVLIVMVLCVWASLCRS